MKLSPTSRSLKKLREEGWMAQVVEKWNPFAKVRQDLFHCIDIVAIRDKEMLGIQCTTMSNKSARYQKIKYLREVEVWISTGARLELWSWRKIKNKWEVDIYAF